MSAKKHQRQFLFLITTTLIILTLHLRSRYLFQCFFEQVNADWVVSDFITRRDCVMNTIASLKTVRVKNNTSNSLIIPEKIHTEDKMYRRFKLTRLHVDKEIYKEMCNPVQNSTRKQKQAYFQEKLQKTLQFLEKLGKTFKQLGPPEKMSPSFDTYLYEKGTNISNFRPTSLLPMISKIIEKVVHDQTLNYQM